MERRVNERQAVTAAAKPPERRAETELEKKLWGWGKGGNQPRLRPTQGRVGNLDCALKIYCAGRGIRGPYHLAL